jgi:hypothetical protein
MAVAMRQASAHDLAALVELMQEFYGEAGFPLNPDRARAAFLPLLAPRAARAGAGGRVRRASRRPLGTHLLLEHGVWRPACVYGRPVSSPGPAEPRGGAGLGVRARNICEELGVRAIHLEVARTNGPAQAIYRAVGFDSTERELLTLALAAPTHAA